METITFYASPERAVAEKVTQQNYSLRNAEFLEEVFSKIPLMFFILNPQRQIVYMNSLMSAEMKKKNLDVSPGLRPGELLLCENAFTEKAGCGTSHQCRYCGIVNAFLESVESDSLVEKEARFVSTVNGERNTVDYSVSSKPFLWEGEKYCIVSLVNISDSKRKQQLEQTFFHDLLNKITSVSGLTEIISSDLTENNLQLIGLLRKGIIDLTNEILFQRSLVEAEAGTFCPSRQRMNTLEVLKGIKDDFLSYEMVANKFVAISSSSEDLWFYSDKVIIDRILTNLVKNALEASQIKESVTIGSDKHDNFVSFWVNNHSVIKEDVRPQLFNRSFSTKGKGRGLGTYSVKLFAEQYLHGKVFFESDEDRGTTFYVNLPLKNEAQSDHTSWFQ